MQKTYVVTGASSGIGNAICQQLAKRVGQLHALWHGKPIPSPYPEHIAPP